MLRDRAVTGQALARSNPSSLRDSMGLDESVAKVQNSECPPVITEAAKGMEMKLREPGIFKVDVARGELAGATNRYVKTYADLDGLYEDAGAFRALVAKAGADTLAYEVTDFKPSEDAGDLIIGVTRMRPGKVGREYFLTRGHIHARANRPEMYYGERGHGVMLLESPEGEVRTIEIGPRTLC